MPPPPGQRLASSPRRWHSPLPPGRMNETGRPGPVLLEGVRFGMKARQSPPFRQGRAHHEQVVVLVMIVAVFALALRLLTPEQAADSKPVLDRVFSALVGLFQCFGLVI